MRPSERLRVQRCGAAILTVVVLIGACISAPATGDTPGASATTTNLQPSGSAAATTAPSSAAPTPAPSASAAVEPVPADLPDDVLWAIEKRREYGMRYDTDWVLAVADDPTATTAFGFPMLPSEERNLWARSAYLNAFVSGIQRYAASHKDEFGGLYLDLGEGVVATLWTDRVDEHLAALLEDYTADAPITGRKVRWAEATLRRVQNRISRDWDWFGRIEAEPMGAGTDIEANVVSIEISSANPRAPRLIAEHYSAKLDIPAEMVHVISDGTGVELMPTGRVEGILVTAEGHRPGRNDLVIHWTPDTAGQCAFPYLGYGVARNGKLEFICTRGWWTAEARVGDPRTTDPFVTVSDPVRVRVRPGKTVTVRIELCPGANVRVEGSSTP